MPAHLQKYKGGNTFIPEHAQNEMTQHLKSALPQHMKQYAGAYMQQRVVEPSLAKRGSFAAPAPSSETPAVAPHPPVVVSPSVPNLAVQPPPQNPPTSGPQASYTQPTDQPQSPDQSYAFITNPAQPPKQSRFSGFRSSSLPIRIGVIAGGLLVLLVVFLVLRGLLSSSPKLDSFVTVAQEQQELIHLVENSNQQASLSASSQNVAATMLASLTTSQGETIKYLTSNGKKIDAKQLNLKVSAATDTQLTDAEAAATYNQTFREILQTKLKAYESTLSSTYNQTQGKKGKALLKDSYRQAQLFQTQLSESAN
jgi:hypothetical protein